MTARILDGRLTAKTIKTELAERVEKLKAAGVTPGLGTVLVGDDPASHTYVAGKRRDCAALGIESISVDLPATATQEDVEAAVDQLNADPACTGYIVQLPLPKGLDSTPILERIDPAKDADGLHPNNLGQLVSRVSEDLQSPQPCTARGCVEILERGDVDLAGKHIVVVGRSILVGRSVSLLLSRRAINATVTMCHSATQNLAEHTRRGDIVIAAVGVPQMITPDMITPGSVVVDVGINRVDDDSEKGYHLEGDVDPAVAEVASAYTPVPGGVGPMTRAILLTNVVEAAERSLTA